MPDRVSKAATMSSIMPFITGVVGDDDDDVVVVVVVVAAVAASSAM